MAELQALDVESPDDPEPAGRQGLIVIGAGATGRGVASRTAKVMSVTVVDRDPGRLEAEELAGVETVAGDATSRLVLRDAGIEDAYALLAATSDDDINVEAARLAVEAGVPEVICRLAVSARVEEVMTLGARPVTGSMAMVGALISRLPGVAVTTAEVGIGEGEILQVRVMPGSLVIGRPLREIATREFLVGAIYRDGELIVPHGDTTVLAGDQVLLVGEPSTLRAIADYFRLGAAQFPMQFGQSLVLWGEDAHDEGVAAEARWLAQTGRIDALYTSVPPGADIKTPGWCPPIQRGRAGAILAPLESLHPAVYVVAPPRRGFWRQLSPSMHALLEGARSPILVARGTTPWKRILVPVTDSPTSFRGLELAVDIARLVDARITALHVTQPRFLAGSMGDERTSAVERAVEQVARLYNLHLEVRFEEGNSIRRAAEVAEEHQLVVAARRPMQPDTYFRPDVGLRIALEAPCSSVILNVS